MKFKEKLKKEIKKQIKQDVFLRDTPSPEFGDYALFLKNPDKKIKSILIERTEVKGNYLNIFINKKKFIEETLKEINLDYGKSNLGKNKTIVIDFSAPNIAKPFSVGHLRSTVIGNSLHKLYSELGYKVIGVNHLGDWGTQFGKLIVAYKRWGNEKKLEEDPIKYLLSLYVKFHAETEKDKLLEDEARNEFRKLEKGDKESVRLWKKFKDLSLEEFENIYSLMKIKFDSYNGEAFYKDMLDDVINKIKQKTKTESSDGALIVNLKQYDMPPLIIKKSNESTSYHTRDIAAALYRLKNYKPERIIYVVGSEQKLHFRQLFKTLELMGEDSKKFVHVDFGLFRFPEGKMSTRKGRVVFLEDVLDKAITTIEKIITKKNPNIGNRKEVAQMVGIGAIIFGDLSNNRVNNINFDWDRMLSFEGETGPYIQYTHARIYSILKKSKLSAKIDYNKFNDEEFQLIKKMSEFPEVIKDSAIKYKPNLLCNYLIQLSQLFNTYYTKYEIKLSKERLYLASKIKQILSTGLNLLGIESPNAM
ncbi:arginine--tRNA ligase [Candidatus Woesearchaeota archaeon]|nr:arginine--tRNA ligase [Candidatus Woesearchaeota archaeon]